MSFGVLSVDDGLLARIQADLTVIKTDLEAMVNGDGSECVLASVTPSSTS